VHAFDRAHTLLDTIDAAGGAVGGVPGFLLAPALAALTTPRWAARTARGLVGVATNLTRQFHSRATAPDTTFAERVLVSA
jgi:hypothetical protein